MKGTVSEVNKCSTVEMVLERYSNCRAFFPHVPGNHGDKLIQMGTMHMVKCAAITPEKDIRKADVVIFFGGGGMNQLWGAQLKPFMYYLKVATDIPIIVLPASFYACNDILKSLLRYEQRKCVFFAREKNSKSLLLDVQKSSPDRVEIFSDHDMAFALSDTEVISRCRRWRHQQKKRHILIVDRGDSENINSNSSLIRPMTPTHWDGMRMRLLRSTIGPVRKYLRINWTRMSGTRYSHKCSPSFMKDIEIVLTQQWIDYKSLPIIYADVSNPFLFSFKEFLKIVSTSALIFTTRLHVGILGSMLGIPVVFQEGRLGKLQGVYDYSLRDWNNVQMMADIIGVAQE